MVVTACGGEAQFEKALREGDIFEVEEDGEVFYAWREMACGAKKTGARVSHTKRANASLNGSEASACDAILSSMSWGFKLTQREAVILDKGGARRAFGAS